MHTLPYAVRTRVVVVPNPNNRRTMSSHVQSVAPTRFSDCTMQPLPAALCPCCLGLPARLPACPPARLPACIPACLLPACLPARLPSLLSSCRNNQDPETATLQVEAGGVAVTVSNRVARRLSARDLLLSTTGLGNVVSGGLEINQLPAAARDVQH